MWIDTYIPLARPFMTAVIAIVYVALQQFSGGCFGLPFCKIKVVNRKEMDAMSSHCKI